MSLGVVVDLFLSIEETVVAVSGVVGYHIRIRTDTGCCCQVDPPRSMCYYVTNPLMSCDNKSE